jgi:hypothetical protein
MSMPEHSRSTDCRSVALPCTISTFGYRPNFSIVDALSPSHVTAQMFHESGCCVDMISINPLPIAPVAPKTMSDFIVVFVVLSYILF